MKTRIITSIVGIALCIAVFIFGEMNPIVAVIVVSVVNTVLCGEYLSAKKLEKQLLIFIPSLLFALAMPLCVTARGWFIPLYLYALVSFITAVVFHAKIKIDDVMFAFGGVSLISLSMAAMVYASCKVYAPGYDTHTAFWMTLTLGIPWIADSAAYFIGSAVGKRKLCPVISPKKSVEGAVSGVVCGTLGAILIGLVYLLIYGNVSVNFGLLALIGLINSVLSIFGDLTFSVVKRQCGIKDYGTIMPGHGGLLDRFDSVIFCAPTVFIFNLFTHVIAYTA